MSCIAAQRNECDHLHCSSLCWEAPAGVELTKSPLLFMTSVREITDTSEFLE